MSEHAPLPEVDENRAAVIEHTLSKSFAFLADVIEHPGLLSEIPGGSKLAFHTLSMPNGNNVRLTAFRPRQSRRWQVRVTGVGNSDTLVQDWWHERPFLWQMQPLIESASWESATAAFTALDEAFRRGTGEQRLAG